MLVELIAKQKKLKGNTLAKGFYAKSRCFKWASRISLVVQYSPKETEEFR